MGLEDKFVVVPEIFEMCMKFFIVHIICGVFEDPLVHSQRQEPRIFTLENTSNIVGIHGDFSKEIQMILATDN